MNATAQRAYSFCGASPADKEHEVRQMRSIWSDGEQTADKFEFIVVYLNFKCYTMSIKTTNGGVQL